MTDNGAPDAIHAEIATIETQMRDDPASYYRDEQTQARYRDLITARESGSALPPVAVDEKAEIERMMRDDPRRYYGSEAIQARYRALIDQEEELGANRRSDERKDAPLVWLADNNAVMAAGWNPATYAAGMRGLADVMFACPESERSGLAECFDALAPTVRGAIIAQMAASPPWETPATDADLDRFATTPEGAELRRQWGYDAPSRLSRARARAEQILASVDDAGAILDWFNGLTSNQARAVIATLANG